MDESIDGNEDEDTRRQAKMSFDKHIDLASGAMTMAWTEELIVEFCEQQRQTFQRLLREMEHGSKRHSLSSDSGHDKVGEEREKGDLQLL